MSLFKCDNCGCVENTALCDYHKRRGASSPRLCSLCDPAIGRWHGRFPRKDADEGGYTAIPDSHFIEQA